MITFEQPKQYKTMKRLPLIFLLLILITSCKEKKSASKSQVQTDTAAPLSVDFTIVFASCNDQNREQPLWLPILENKPDLFIWGGDNIYSDTADMEKWPPIITNNAPILIIQN